MASVVGSAACGHTPTCRLACLSRARISIARIRELGHEISRDYAKVENLHLICVLKGAFMFLADLVRTLQVPVTLDFMALSSYATGTTSSGEVRLLKDLDTALAGRDVLIVEDIVDTGSDAELSP